MKLYAIRNKEGKYFRPIGRNGRGQNWQETLEKAKLYSKIGTAKAQISWWYKNYPSYGCPDLIVFELGLGRVEDVKTETELKIVKAKTKKLKDELQYKRWQQSALEHQRREIDKQIQALQQSYARP